MTPSEGDRPPRPGSMLQIGVQGPGRPRPDRSEAFPLSRPFPDPEAYALEGFLHDFNGRTDDATASYRAALYLDASLFQVRVLLADCLLRLGHNDLAKHQYREALAVLESGRERTLTLFADLPLPDRERARRRCQDVLRRG